MEIRILGAHSTEAKGFYMTSLLIDGILALDAGSLTLSLSLLEQQEIKAILLTHQHFDHSRDLITFGANNAMRKSPVEIYALRQTLDIVTSCLLDGKIYIDFSKWPSQEKPFLQTKVIEPFRTQVIQGYEVLALPVNHSVPAIGYQITSNGGKSLFYTGDTGPGLSSCWEYISPHLLIIEVSGINEAESFLKMVGHLSAQFLKEELVQFRKAKGYLPRVVAIHMTPQYEDVIRQEINDVAKDLGINIDIGYEGMVINL
jgi:phosphoribosyl 1,2-cyclic phosphodiesterase